jgi:hypothetical protein
MKDMTILPSEGYGYGFIPREYLPQGKDEYWLRDEQAPEIIRGSGVRRSLKPAEIEILIKNGNHCSDWDRFLVSDLFDPNLIQGSRFYGLIRLGTLRNVLLKYHDFCVPAGIRNSTIISCDIGGDTSVQDCAYISHYIIGDECILSRIDEMQTTNHAKFGNGIIKEGEDEEVRVWIDVMNEAGGRSILPFADMIPADAYLWAAYRDDTALTDSLKALTQRRYGSRRGYYGTVGSGSVIKSCAIIKDTAIGRAAYIKGVNKMKNITVNSSEEESTQIGEGVELINGIIGYGCHVFYGSKAVRFVLGRNCNLKYGARLIHSVLGDNSTVSCCEILNNLIFPIHEQHHNNSFLIASLVQGMSNMAAGATVGSNHNSRANDGEIRAGRGFWPGLSVTLKHPSRFASYTLIVKGDYPYELNISLPFSLVNNNAAQNRLEVMPAYFWMYNMYALERNSWKAANRDKRRHKIQHIEMDYLAPDTAEEIITALGVLENCMRDAGMSVQETSEKTPDVQMSSKNGGLDEDPEYAYTPDESVPAQDLERHSRGAVILKPRQAYLAYRQMLRFYAVKALIAYLELHPALTFKALAETMRSEDTLTETASARVTEWVNLGGQVTPAFRVDELRRRIREGMGQPDGAISWNDIHGFYDAMDEAYGEDKVRHAWAVLRLLLGGNEPDAAAFKQNALAALEIRRWMAEQVYRSRAKDYKDPFRGITYRNQAEMEQVVGTPEDNSFVKSVRAELTLFEKSVNNVIGLTFGAVKG